MFNKKGQGISLNFLIIAALALIALIVIALFFTGGIAKIFGKQKGVVQLTDQELKLVEESCGLYCSLDQEAQYGGSQLSAELKAAGYNSCSDVPGRFKGTSYSECKKKLETVQKKA